MKRLPVFLLLFLLCPYICQAQPKVALLLEHEQISPWTALLRAGLEKAKTEFDILSSIIIAPPGPQQEKIFRDAASSHDLVLVTGESLHELLRNNAASFRKVKFGCIDAGIRAPNIMCITFADEQAAFLAGAAAAIVTNAFSIPGINKDQTLGWLSGMDTPALRSLYNGFAEGARLVNPKITISQQVTGSFTNPEEAAVKTANILAQKADIITLASGMGNMAAAKELSRAKAWRIDLDMPNQLPGALGTIEKAADKAVYEIVRDFSTDNFQGKKIIIYNLENGGTNFTGIENFIKQTSSNAPSSLKRRIEELKKELIQGSIHIKSLRTRTLCDCID